MESFEEYFENRSRELLSKYPGLRKEDLEKMNPTYSCVVCKKYLECGKKGCACNKAEKATEDEFVSYYDF